MSEAGKVDGTENVGERVPHTHPAPKKILGYHERLRIALEEERDKEKLSKVSDNSYIERLEVAGDSVTDEHRLKGAVRLAEKKVKVEYDVEDVSLPLRSGTITARFLGHCAKDMDTGCWNWVGYWNQNNGVPEFSFMKRQFNARRISYELFMGDTKFWSKFHSDCENPRCVNPEHIRRYKSYRDEQNLKRPYKVTRCDKLSQEDVDNIRGSKLSRHQLAARYNISTWMVWAIQSGKRRGTRQGDDLVFMSETDTQKIKRDKAAMLMKAGRILADLEASTVELEQEEMRRSIEAFTEGLE